MLRVLHGKIRRISFDIVLMSFEYRVLSEDNFLRVFFLKRTMEVWMVGRKDE